MRCAGRGARAGADAGRQLVLMQLVAGLRIHDFAGAFAGHAPHAPTAAPARADGRDRADRRAAERPAAHRRRARLCSCNSPGSGFTTSAAPLPAAPPRADHRAGRHADGPPAPRRAAQAPAPAPTPVPSG